MIDTVNTEPIEENIAEPIVQPIDEAEIRKASEILQRYKDGKNNLDSRVISNEEWYRLRQWELMQQESKVPADSQYDRIEEKKSAWLLNSIDNKHADAMDAYPEPAVLPRAFDDEETAKQLSSILPVIFDNCNFEQTYSDNWWEKIKHGTAIYAVLWDPSASGGLGNIAIKDIDLLSIYWEPGKKDIQDSRNVFTLSIEDNDILEQTYPQLKGKLSNAVLDIKEYNHDYTIDTSDKSVVVDWYYKVNRGGQTVLHYVKYVGDTVLFATENENGYEDGLYTDGQYPFVFDILYPDKGTPAGIGAIDRYKNTQEYIDRLGGAIVLHAEEAARRKTLVKDSMGINEEEFNNPYKRLVHVTGSPNDDNYREVVVNELSSVYVTVLQDEINALKETSGNRDFNQGGTTSGVTAASAIQALQEEGNKLSRDQINGSYRAYSKLGKLCLERIRQFYDIDRVFRITGEGGVNKYVSFNNANMKGGVQSIAGQEFKTKEPEFDIVIRAQKQNPYSKLSQNELALQFYKLGFFNPELASQAAMCIDMMDFDGKDKILQKIAENGTIQDKLNQMQQLLALAGEALAERGDPRVMQALQQMGGTAQPTPSSNIDTEAASNDNSKVI